MTRALITQGKAGQARDTSPAGPSGIASPDPAVLQRAEGHGRARHPVASLVETAIASPSAPLDSSTRAFVEPRLGHDFSRVRVHADTNAGRSAAPLDALAYTVGEHIVFATGTYAPHTDRGRHLLAHEL